MPKKAQYHSSALGDPRYTPGTLWKHGIKQRDAGHRSLILRSLGLRRILEFEVLAEHRENTWRTTPILKMLPGYTGKSVEWEQITEEDLPLYLHDPWQPTDLMEKVLKDAL